MFVMLAITLLLLLATVLVNSAEFMDLDSTQSWDKFTARRNLVANIGTFIGTMFFISFAILLACIF